MSTAADTYDVLYQWAKEMYANAAARFQATSDVKEIHIETGTMGAYNALIQVLEELRAEGFTDAEELAHLRKTIREQQALLETQTGMIDRLLAERGTPRDTAIVQ